ncbi:MAG: IclR family transcriptional regulator [Puniceicoccales bacterium]
MSGESYLERVFAVLEVASAHPSGLSLAQVTKAVEFPKPTVLRILRSLVSLGYLMGSEDGGYRISGKLFSLLPPSDDDFLRSTFLPVLQEVHDELNETVNLGRMEGLRVRYLHILESTQPLRWIPDERLWDEALRTALGRAMVAHWAAEEREDLLPSLLERSGYSRTGAIVQELERTRERGWAEESEESCAGVCCFAVPLFRSGEVVAALSVSTPQIRTIDGGRDRILDVLLEAGRSVSRASSTEQVAL